jgi:hypothetical protein
VHERDDVDVPGCAYDQAQKVERVAPPTSSSV